MDGYSDLSDISQMAGEELNNIFFPLSFHQKKTCILLTNYLLIPFIHSSSIDIMGGVDQEMVIIFSNFLWPVMEDEFSSTYVQRANIIMDRYFNEEAERFLRYYSTIYQRKIYSILQDLFGNDIGLLTYNFL